MITLNNIDTSFQTDCINTFLQNHKKCTLYSQKSEGHQVTNMQVV